MKLNVGTDGASKKCAAGILNHCVDIDQLVLKREKCVAGFSDICLQSAQRPSEVAQIFRKNHTGPIFDPGGENRDNASSSCNCGLGVQRDTGRLRWCPGSRWSRLLFVIPAALLPLLGLFVLLSSLGAVGAGDSLITRRGSGAPMQRRDSCTAVRYGLPEHLEAEEREVLSDLRTSFIPPESVVPPNCVVGRSIRSKRLSCTEGKCDLSSRRTRFIGNLSTDITIWANTSYGDNPILKLHKVSNFTLENDEPLASDGNPKYNTEHKLEKRDDYAQDIESSGDVEFDVHSPNKSGVAEIQLPWKITSLGKDARPITDNDFKQSQQFELEDAELLESPPALAPHAVWRGQGSPEYIRSAQAEAMKRYMDPTADPCIDFYQHACGNWERYNPIPPDKAGYDTFEMLRESLDQVLRELLVEVPKTTTKFTNYDSVKSSDSNPDMQVRHLRHVRRNYQQNPFQKHRHHKHHQRKPNITKERKEGNDEDSDIYNDSKLESKDRSIIDLLRRFRGQDFKRGTRSDHKSRGGLFNLRQVLLIRRIRSMLGARKQHKRQNLKRNEDKSFLTVTESEFISSEKIKVLNKEYNVESVQTNTERNNHKKKTAEDYNNLGRGDDEYEDPAGYITTSKPGTNVNSTKNSVTSNSIKHYNIDCDEHDAVYKARALYESCMNYAVLKRRGNSPLLDLLNKLGGWPAINPDWNEKGFDWLQLTAQLRMYNNDILIAEWVGPDIKNSDEYVIQFDQTSLGLPTRDYYLESINIPYLNAYREYMLTITTLLGANPANVSCIVEEILDFETKLAQITTAPEDRRNVSVLYQRLSIGRLKQLVPQIDWIRYLNIVLERPINPNETVVMFALGYMQDLVRLLARSDARTVSNYLMWRFVRHRVNNLDDRFQPAKQKFYYVLFGREQSPPRWKNCVSQVNTNMGMALGSLFVRKYFDYTSKNDTTVMTSEIQQSFRELLYKTDWIDNQTKRLAAEKVNAIILRIGYPDYVLEPETLNDKYKDVNIDKGKYFENTLEILTHLTRAEQSRLGQLVNKTVWHTAPAVVNAYYSRNKNQIMFPAGILQPPFYHRYFPRSLNYGGIGVVIGHELTHGFDDKGRLFDKEGNLHKWWSEKSIDAFHERAQCLIDQYSNYTVPEVDLQIDGFNTQGENIADNGGIKQAFRAYRRWLKLHGNSNETLPGINATNTQLFFLNFAQVWCGAMRPEAMRNKLKTAVHSPGKFRVIGTLSNSEDFAREYNCPRGSPMNPIKKCSVW